MAPTAKRAPLPGARRSAEAVQPTQQRKIFVGGLAHSTTTADLAIYFERFGKISDAVVLRWPDGNSRGFGYVTFVKEAALDATLSCKHVVNGQQVEVKRAVPSTNKIFVGRLPPQTTDADVHQYFASFGAVSSAVVMMDSLTGRSRGFGFVCFQPGLEGKKAMDAALDQKHRIHKKWIDVKSAASYQEMSVKGGDAMRVPSCSGGTTSASDGGGSRSRVGSGSGGSVTPPSDVGDGESGSDCGGPPSTLTPDTVSLASLPPWSSPEGMSRQRSASLDMDEPQKVMSSLLGVSQCAFLSGAGALAMESEPVDVYLPCAASKDLVRETCKLQVDAPAKVHTSLTNTMPGVVMPLCSPPLACGRSDFAASNESMRRLESLLKLEVARVGAREHSNKLAHQLAEELIFQIVGTN
jgi:RNA-binding protein Musashi